MSYVKIFILGNSKNSELQMKIGAILWQSNFLIPHYSVLYTFVLEYQMDYNLTTKYVIFKMYKPQNIRSNRHIRWVYLLYLHYVIVGYSSL